MEGRSSRPGCRVGGRLRAAVRSGARGDRRDRSRSRRAGSRRDPGAAIPGLPGRRRQRTRRRGGDAAPLSGGVREARRPDLRAQGRAGRGRRSCKVSCGPVGLAAPDRRSRRPSPAEFRLPVRPPSRTGGRRPVARHVGVVGAGKLTGPTAVIPRRKASVSFRGAERRGISGPLPRPAVEDRRSKNRPQEAAAAVVTPSVRPELWAKAEGGFGPKGLRAGGLTPLAGSVIVIGRS